MDTLRILVHTAELFAAILASIYFYKYKNSPLRYFIYYLWYVVINEAAVYFLLPLGLFRFELSNLYNLVTPIFVIWTCRGFLVTHSPKKILSVLVIIIIAVNISEGLLKGVNENPWTVSKTVGTILGIITFSIYLTNIFKTNLKLNLTRDIFTYFLHVMLSNLNYIMGIIVVLMYLIFAFGFYYGEKK